jgi:peptide/nickel transport system substrate-binding protein
LFPWGRAMGDRQLAVVAVVTFVAVMLAGCTGAEPPPPSRLSAPPPASSITSSGPSSGGEATIGAEQWPECLNPILSCGEPVTYQTVLYHVLPRAMQFAPDGSLVPSPLLSEAPTLDNGGLTQTPFTIRYRIKGGAVWDDGSPITAEDFAFTWQAILHTRGSVLVDDYQRILAIDTTDPTSPVLRLDEPWAGWTELFGGSKGFVLKEAAFPDADPEAPSLLREMKTDIPFSGGPFRLDEWVKDEDSPTNDHAVLERNDRYFGPRAYLDRVTFVPWLDLNTEMGAFLNGDQDAMTLSAADLATSGLFPFELEDSPSITSVGGDSTSFEALWFNAHERPLKDPLVREALMHAIDRQGLVDALISGNNPHAEVLNCGFLALPGTPACRTKPFEPFTYDPARSIDLLKQAGYDCTSRPCARNGKPLEVPYYVFSVRRLRTLTQEFIIDRALPAGFSFKVISFEGTGPLFGSQCPWGVDIALTECAVEVSADSSLTGWFDCDQVQVGPLVGLNQGWCNEDADRLVKASDRQLDPATRVDLLDQLFQVQAEDMIGLPLYVIPTLVAWREDRLGGPIDAYLSTPYGPFFNVSEWYLATP